MEPLEKQLEIRAAGAVLWRRAERPRIQVAVVHRPHYDDWSLPKGKLDPDETIPAAAAREVHEETGTTCVLDRFLTDAHYSVPLYAGNGSVPKTVSYFSAQATGGAFVPNSEIDELRWLEPAQARRILSYPTEIEALDTFTELAPGLTTVLLVRHGKAGKREHWEGDDDLRPLSDAGLRQAAALATLLPLFAPRRVHSAPRLRCVQTVQPVADTVGTDIVHEPLLSEEGYWKDPAEAVERLLTVISEGETPVVCSQGKVIPDIIATLATRDRVTVPRVPSKKGSTWLLTFASGTQDSRPALRAAHYLPSPLPSPSR